MRTFKVPNTLVLLFAMQVLALVITWVLPAGEFETTLNEAGRELVVPGTFALLEDSPSLSVVDLLTAVPRGMADSQGIIFFVLIVGGVLAVIRHTGAIEALLGRILQRFSTRTGLLIFFPMFAFAVGASTFGMAVEFITLVALLMTFCLAMRLDAMTAVGILVVGYGIGYGAAAMNPFTVMVAQDVADLPPGSGIGLRLAIFLPLLLLGFHHVYRYAQRVKADPSASLVYDLRHQHEAASVEEYPPLTTTRKLVLLVMMLGIMTLVSGVILYGWYLTELSALFVALGIITAIVARITPDDTAVAFSKGVTDLAATALLIGMARGIALILEDGQVLYTIVHGLSVPLTMVGAELAVVGMLLMQSLLNFFIPSGSGQAYVTMPLMAPMSDLLGISRQTAVLAYQFGDGFTNMIIPTNGILMGILGIAGIPYDRWFRFLMPLMLKLFLASSAILIGAVWFGY
ncbi:MAG: TIGR00366 family protein [Pseudohongiella sp.]|uniref:YfcC family protein n=1 Tax=Pseudohongiella sp. TaxID=1979412 RepID=UPI0034A0611E